MRLALSLREQNQVEGIHADENRVLSQTTGRLGYLRVLLWGKEYQGTRLDTFPRWGIGWCRRIVK